MKAAVLHTLGQPPRYEEFPEPIPGEGEQIVHVRAASLKNIDKMMAAGTHYDSYRTLPVICGVDGVGVLDDGTRVYFGARRPYGALAERTIVSKQWCMPLPAGLDDITAAALPNPALSAWLPLVWRARLKPGETVLVLGATGVSGKLAIQIAKHLGAGRVVAAGRNVAVLHALPGLGADALIQLDQPEAEVIAAFAREAGKGYDVVLDYLWGRPTELLLTALTGHDVQAEAVRTRLVEIGEMAGSTITLPGKVLRSSGLELYGSGGGGLPPQVIVDAFPQVLALAASGGLQIDTETVPLAAIEQTWLRRDPHNRRFVVIP